MREKALRTGLGLPCPEDSETKGDRLGYNLILCLNLLEMLCAKSGGEKNYDESDNFLLDFNESYNKILISECSKKCSKKNCNFLGLFIGNLKEEVSEKSEEI